VALTSDQITVRYGAPGNSTQPVNKPLTANATVYRGSIATTRSGYLVAASSPQSTDIVWGLVQGAGPGTADQTTPGIVGGTTNGAVTVEIATGSFFLASGTGADAITGANVGATCYVINETTVGLTNGSNTRPQAGVIEEYDTNEIYALGFVAVKLGSAQTTGAPS
jgi:hypothetical protein